MASTTFDFIDDLTKDYSMSSEVIESISRTHTSKLPTFIGWQYASLITHKCLVKENSTSIYNQYLLWVHHTQLPNCPSTHE